MCSMWLMPADLSYAHTVLGFDAWIACCRCSQQVPLPWSSPPRCTAPHGSSMSRACPLIWRPGIALPEDSEFHKYTSQHSSVFGAESWLCTISAACEWTSKGLATAVVWHHVLKMARHRSKGNVLVSQYTHQRIQGGRKHMTGQCGGWS